MTEKAPPIIWEGSPKLREFLVPIDSLAPHADNPRIGDVDAVAGSLARFGQRKPIVAAGGVIYAGNHTWRAARDVLGWTHIAVVDGSDIPEAELDAFLLADNRSSDLGKYEDELLLAALERLSDDDRGLDGTGYSGDDVDDLRARLSRLAEAEASPSAPSAEEIAARERLKADGQALREIVLMATEEQFERLGAWIKMLRKHYGTEGITETIYRCIEAAAKSL